MISILLASYNGEKYIAEQIESILNQTEQNFRLYINDDCSTDNTFKISKDYEKKYPDKIKVTRNEKNSGSAKYNFINMMIEHKDDYIMLCDQDDVWLPNKIEITLKKMVELEKKYGKFTPLLVHTDLKIVDTNLAEISESSKNYLCANYDKTKLNNLIIQNIVTGCTAMYNKTLADLTKYPKGFIVMHDWWLALTASAFGIIEHCDEQTVLYRQHGDNSVGVHNMKSLKFVLTYTFKSNLIKNAIYETFKQSETFLRTYNYMLLDDEKEFLREYSMLNYSSKLKKLNVFFKYKTFKNGFFRVVAQFMFC